VNQGLAILLVEKLRCGEWSQKAVAIPLQLDELPLDREMLMLQVRCAKNGVEKSLQLVSDVRVGHVMSFVLALRGGTLFNYSQPMVALQTMEIALLDARLGGQAAALGKACWICVFWASILPTRDLSGVEGWGIQTLPIGICLGSLAASRSPRSIGRDRICFQPWSA